MTLFQTNAWQYSWWQTWGSTKGFELLRESVYPTAGLYVDHYRYKRVLPVRCLQFVGTNYRRISTPRTEYNSFGGGEDKSGAKVLDDLEPASWSEAVFRDMVERSDDVVDLKKLAESRGWFWRIVAEDVAYAVDTAGEWPDYLSRLGSSTRLRLFNRRKVLEDQGKVALVNAWPDQVDSFFHLLNGFHQERWGRPCFGKESLIFHRNFLSQVENEGGSPDLSVLYCGSRPISVLYNVVFKGCVYNIQAGFEEDFHKKLAVGTLHLGYSIEDAFRRREVRKFDLLAGGGKRENYKARLATHTENLISVMVVRSRLFQFLYRIKP